MILVHQWNSWNMSEKSILTSLPVWFRERYIGQGNVLLLSIFVEWECGNGQKINECFQFKRNNVQTICIGFFSNATEKRVRKSFRNWRSTFRLYHGLTWRKIYILIQFCNIFGKFDGKNLIKAFWYYSKNLRIVNADFAVL